VTESGGAVGDRGLDYLYLGQGGSWYEGSDNGEGCESSHEWETTQSEAVKKSGQAPSRPLILRVFRRFCSEPCSFCHSLIDSVPPTLPNRLLFW
jgi:hypothetical protein